MKKMRAIVIGVMLLPLMALGQAYSVDKHVHDFGKVNFWKNDTAYFMLRNEGKSDMIFLPTFYNEKFQLLLPDKRLAPGSSGRLGVIFYSEKAGSFSEYIEIYHSLSPDPIKLWLKGNIKQFHPDAMMRCPTVNSGGEDNRIAKVFTIEVRDLATDEILDPDMVAVHDQKARKIKLYGAHRFFEMEAVSGYYKFSAKKKTYNDYEANVLLEPTQSKFIVYMTKDEEDHRDTPEVPVVVYEPPIISADPEPYHEHPDTTVYHVPEPGPDEPLFPPDVDPPNIEIPPVNEDSLDIKIYKLNNIILVVDVSTSMKRDAKMDKLKDAVAYLVDGLRSADKVGVISFSDQAATVQEPGLLTEKDSVKARVARIKVGGGTNGGAAIQSAYALSGNNFVEDGNNQIIIATDGIFSGGSLRRKQLEQIIADGHAHGMHLSTIALGADPKAMDFLKHLAEIGGGSFIQIHENAEYQAQILEMIKLQSKR